MIGLKAHKIIYIIFVVLLIDFVNGFFCFVLFFVIMTVLVFYYLRGETKLRLGSRFVRVMRMEIGEEFLSMI